ncbi:MAG TPA: VanW family protein [Candidatus Dojkabacteria bacterium]|nr:VanW family protein [Candidatus Dojkabacteria bacterium]
MKKPIKRSKLRLFLGNSFYSLLRYLYWYISRVNFATEFKTKLPVEIFFHKTILRRKLKDVDMWMQENKIENLKIAIKKLDGIVVKPGQTFSYWRLIGKPTVKKGYLEGMVLNNGKVLSAIGGGLCQLSNLIFWITLHSPLSVVERWRHSYDVFPDVKRDQPFGSGATCAYPNLDLQIRNNTQQDFQLSLEIDDTYLIGRWLSDKPIEFKYKVFEKDHEFKKEWFGGYSRNNKIFRSVIDKKTDFEIREEFITENHALMMYNPLIEYKDQSQ